MVLDAGCGNGKYLGTRTDVFSFGTDRSDGLLGICRAKNFEVALGDALNLPVRAESVDSVICIAVIHHLASEERRKEAIREMSRVLRKGGTMLIYVWSFEARSKGRNTQKLNGQEAYVSWKMPKRFRGKNTEAVQDTGDLEVMRYYHLFKEGELERLVLESFSAQGQNSLFIEQSGFDHENWFIIAKKT